MFHSRSHRFALLAVALATILAGACTEIDAGTPSPGPSTRNVAEEIADVENSNLRSSFGESAQEVNDYWTSDRIQQAAPQPLPDGASDVPAVEPLDDVVILEPSTGPTGSVAPDANGSVSSGEVWSYSGLSNQTVGRLYLSFPDWDSYCSAAVVSSKSKLIVATAAHCVFDTSEEYRQGFATNIMFVPGDRGGQTSHGRWVMERVWVPTIFTTDAHSSGERGAYGEGWAYDVAFMRMRPLEGRKIQDALGSQGLAFGLPAEGFMVLGYPAEAPFDGSIMRYCSAPQWTEEQFGGYDIPCVMTGGCSGGPWLTRFDPDRGVGYLVSTTSRGTDTNLFSSFYGVVAYDIFQAAEKGAA